MASIPTKDSKDSGSPTWVTQSGGRRIPIASMHDFHLVNAIRMVQRNNDKAGAELVPGYSDLIKEAEKRGLKI